MKKNLVRILACCLGLLLLAACGAAEPAPTPEPEATPEPTQLETDELLDIAFSDLGVTLTDCHHVKSKLQDGQATVTFTNDGTDYTYVLDLYTGEILSKDSAASTLPEPLSEDELWDLALASVGVTSEDNYYNMKFHEDGDETGVYFTFDGYDYVVILDSYTGEVLDSDKTESAEPEPLTADELIDLAVAEIGIETSDAYRLKASISSSEGTVTFIYDGNAYTILLDKYTGEVLEVNHVPSDELEPLTAEELMDIAIADAGAFMSDCSHIRTGRSGNVSFTFNGYDYAYSLDPFTGEILSVDKKENPDAPKVDTQELTHDRLMDIAFAQAGKPLDGLSDVKLNFKTDACVVSYKLTDGQYTVVIDLTNGEVLEVTKP